MAIRLADTARPNNYVDAEHKGTFPVAYAEDVWFEDGTRLSEKTFDGQSIQKEELPLASADELGNIYQYVGETGTYKNGHFYKCIFNSSVYSWSEIKMVEKPVVYSETVPDINAYETGSIVCYTGEDSGSFEKGHLYQKNETSFTYYYWTFYRDSAKTQPYIFYTQEETLANGVNVYQANPTTGKGDISLVGSIANYQEFSFFVNGSSSVQYFHPEADTSKNRTITEGDWVDIGGGSKLDNVFLVKDSKGAATLAVSQRTFTGTQAEWDALTTDEKLTYKQVNITDDESSIGRKKSKTFSGTSDNNGFLLIDDDFDANKVVVLGVFYPSGTPPYRAIPIVSTNGNKWFLNVSDLLTGESLANITITNAIVYYVEL